VARKQIRKDDLASSFDRSHSTALKDLLFVPQDLIHTFASELGVSEGEAHSLLFGPAVDSSERSSFTKAALLVFAVNAGAFAFQRPAYLLWAEEGRSFDPYFYRSSNPRVETGRVGVSVFPAVVVTRNQVELGKVFALPD
jgi:hypothetical protein